VKPLDPNKLAAAMVQGAQKYIDAAMAPVLERLEAAEARAAEAETKIAELVAETVAEAVGALPPAVPGKSITVDDVRPVIASEVAQAVDKAVSAIPAPKDGAPGKLPLVKAWVDAVHHEGDVVAHAGATWQAQRDTGKEPPHADWICLAAAGESGKDADEIVLRETYDPEASYKRLNIVALNGSAFMARKDDPGPCPGAGWQVIAMRGKPGAPGEGRKGDPGIRGLPGPSVAGLALDDDGLLTLVNSDGSTATCDFYPLLSRIAR
jgi:hypothetical protein